MQGERASRFDKGLAVSASVHAALLVSTLVAFSDARRFDEAQEALPVEVVTAAELNQIMRGEKTAKPAEKPATRAEQQADRVESKPEPPTEQASRDVPVPPPPLRREPDPGEAQERAPPVPTPPPAPPRVAAVPPEPQRRPEPPAPPPRPEPPKAEAKPERPAPEKAEPVPEPPRRPEPPKAEAKPAPPPPRPKPPEQKPPEPKPPEPKAAEKPKDDKPRLDQVAKLLEDRKREERKPAAKPRTGEAEQPPSKYDPANIKRMLSREAPQQTASTGREVSRTASLGTATASAQRMSPSLWGQLDGLLQEQYRECWNKLGFDGQSYVPQIRVTYNADGSLAAQPVLVNPPSDPSQRSLADSAMRAVQKCNPLRIPPQFAPYHAQWKARTLRFDPEEM